MKQISSISYDKYVQEALRGIVSRVLSDVERDGLPGSHHFYIAFRTRYPGVQIPQHLLEKYPEEMTIVIQHRFWELQVLEDRFEIGLSFNQSPTKITIPFKAIVGFHDPAVSFGLQFQINEVETLEDEIDEIVSDEDSNIVAFHHFRKKN